MENIQRNETVICNVTMLPSKKCENSMLLLN